MEGQVIKSVPVWGPSEKEENLALIDSPKADEMLSPDSLLGYLN
uniref:Uncharacterized protein n=1 Tax=Utricularia reniformis TaxID=192314 RepID=A0A1Y0B0H6_9LAMI|nr:hypothetical protein AEK19_MT0710 [Utricularia reniformis]ART30956.1 hypothetical protein AEK19_MT0710 [Utricularia reniformis]